MPSMIRATKGKFAGQVVPVSVFAAEAKAANPALKDYDDETIAEVMVQSFPDAYSWEEQKQAEPQKPSGGSMLGDVVANFPKSYGKAVFNTALAPVYLLGLVGQVGASAVNSMLRASGYGGLEHVPGFSETMSSIGESVWDYYKNRYLADGALERTIRTDPAGAMQDLGSLLATFSGGVGLGARVAGASRAADAAKAVSLWGARLDPGYQVMRGAYLSAMHRPISRLAEQRLRSALKYSEQIDPEIPERHLKILREHEIELGPRGVQQIDQMVNDITQKLDAAVEAADQAGAKVSWTPLINVLKERWQKVGGAEANQKLQEIYKFVAAPTTKEGAGVVNRYGGAIRKYYVEFLDDEGGLKPGNPLGPFLSEEAAKKYIQNNSNLGPARIVEGEIVTFYPEYHNVMERLRQNVGGKVPESVLDPISQKLVYMDEQGRTNVIYLAPQDMTVKQANLFRKAENMDYEMNRAYQQQQKGAVGEEYMRARLDFDKALRDAIYETLENHGLGSAQNWRELGHYAKDLIDIRDQIRALMIRSASANPLGGTNPYVIASAVAVLDRLLAGSMPARLATTVAVLGALKWKLGKDPALMSRVLYGLMKKNPNLDFWNKVMVGLSLGKPVYADGGESRQTPLEMRGVAVEMPVEDVGPDPFGGGGNRGQRMSADPFR